MQPPPSSPPPAKPHGLPSWTENRFSPSGYDLIMIHLKNRVENGTGLPINNDILDVEDIYVTTPEKHFERYGMNVVLSHGYFFSFLKEQYSSLEVRATGNSSDGGGYWELLNDSIPVKGDPSNGGDDDTKVVGHIKVFQFYEGLDHAVRTNWHMFEYAINNDLVGKKSTSSVDTTPVTNPMLGEMVVCEIFYGSYELDNQQATEVSTNVGGVEPEEANDMNDDRNNNNNNNNDDDQEKMIKKNVEDNGDDAKGNKNQKLSVHVSPSASTNVVQPSDAAPASSNTIMVDSLGSSSSSSEYVRSSGGSNIPDDDDGDDYDGGEQLMFEESSSAADTSDNVDTSTENED